MEAIELLNELEDQWLSLKDKKGSAFGYAIQKDYKINKVLDSPE